MILNFRTRVLIAFGFMAAFLVVAPPLVWYTSGLRYDLKSREWYTPGWIILESAPTKADVYLNGRDTGLKTPATIKNLRPDSYQVEVRLPGRTTWGKLLEVKPGLATFARHIILFNESAVQEKLAGLTGYSFSPDLKWLALYPDKSNESVSVIRADNGLEEKVLVPVGEKIKDIVWETDGDEAVVAFTSGQFGLYRSGEKNIASIKLPLGSQVRSFYQNEIFYVTADGSARKLSPASDATETLLTPSTSEQLQDMASIKGKLYLIEKVKGVAATYLATVENGRTQVVNRLPLSDYEFLEGGTLISLLDKTNGLIHLLNPEEKTDIISPELILPAKGLAWSQDKTNLLYYGKHEIGIWNRETQQKELITRLTRPIDWAAWLAGEQYIMYSTEGKLWVIERDGRDVRNTHLLVDLSAVSKTPAPQTSLPVVTKKDESKILFLLPGAEGFTLFEREL